MTGQSSYPSALRQSGHSRVLIVDDHPFFSRGLAQVLKRDNPTGEVAIASTLAGALADLHRHPETELVLLDLGLPDQEGLTLLRELDAIGLAMPVIVISSREDEEAVLAAEAAGASGFLCKSADTPLLLKTLQQIRGGHTCFPPCPGRPVGPVVQLTRRQRDVLTLLASGSPNKAICRTLDLSEHTVKSHLKTIYARLDVHNRTECVQLAQQLGLVPECPARVTR